MMDRLCDMEGNSTLHVHDENLQMDGWKSFSGSNIKRS